jgi:hypothetical protein
MVSMTGAATGCSPWQCHADLHNGLYSSGRTARLFHVTIAKKKRNFITPFVPCCYVEITGKDAEEHFFTTDATSNYDAVQQGSMPGAFSGGGIAKHSRP